MSTIGEKKKSFKLYEELLPELRKMVLDEMNPDDRCRFTRCSKLSRTEAMSSKKYIYKLGVAFRTKKHIEIDVSHNVCNSYREDYVLRFRKEKGIRTMKCVKGGKELWSVELSKSTNLTQMALQRFRKLLQLYQDKIKVLRIQYFIRAGGQDFDLGITSLKNLTYRYIDGDFSWLDFLSKIRNPLETLNVWKNSNRDLFKDMIYQVEDVVWIPELTLNNEQFSQLKASTIYISVGKLTVEDVFNFIRSWQNGTIGRRMEMLASYHMGRIFSVRQLFGLFGYNDDGKSSRMEVAHFKDSRKKVLLITDQFHYLTVQFYD